jgi:hypothetical protein
MKNGEKCKMETVLFISCCLLINRTVPIFANLDKDSILTETHILHLTFKRQAVGYTFLRLSLQIAYPYYYPLI